jgi:hypothetical protein
MAYRPGRSTPACGASRTEQFSAAVLLRGRRAAPCVHAQVDASPALFLVHDYHAGMATLEAVHVQPSITASGLSRNPATEEQLWSYLVQLASALRAVHSAGLACRPVCLAPSKVHPPHTPTPHKGRSSASA